ncbi:efflux RND transporter periplasmic adaptor subunit [Phragmitibacter flavus]|uniref:Efflux RND transporter periplasmic adaptor subunit n=1 Tax=Phragmitibacter flavus TaxID=2576071 RepID=A0A5R8K9E8_9BACT|nr:efflux RND transporter periplasmic adaptor subunit [Phragmitibacter flavus]TLD68921.1 efflux RND transporter periplasmic adaptor subunit [Phragmitibacter flavus]
MNATTTPNTENLSDIILGANAPARPWTKLTAALILVALVVTAWLWWSHRTQAQNQASPYITEPLKRGDINLTITATGNLEPTNEVTVGSELSGTTLAVYVDTNDHVTKGQPLAKLDSSKLNQQTESSRASLRSAQAKVAQAEATLKESEASLARTKNLEKLTSGKAVSTADVDTAIATAERAKADLLSAKAAVGEAEAQVRINESDLEKAIIKSPIDGIVLTRNLEPGQTVAASFTAPELFVIAEKLEHMKLKVAVAEADIGRVANQQTATFTVDAWPDRSYTANVTKVSYGSAVTDNVVTYEAELQVTNDDLSLRPGMTATADIRVAEATQAYLVPNAALRFNPTTASASAAPPKKSFVQNLIPSPRGGGSRPKTNDTPNTRPTAGNHQIWILRDGKPQSLPVKLGISDGRHTEVISDNITEGLPVIIQANANAITP